MESSRLSRRKRSKPLPSVEIREMELRDVPEVFELGQKLFTAEEWPSLYRSWDDHELALLFSNDAETCLIAEADGKVVGFAAGPRDGKTAQRVALRLAVVARRGSALQT